MEEGLAADGRPGDGGLTRGGCVHGNVEDSKEVEKELLKVAAAITSATKKEVRRQLHGTTGMHGSFGVGATGGPHDTHGDVPRILDLARHLQPDNLQRKLHPKQTVMSEVFE